MKVHQRGNDLGISEVSIDAALFVKVKARMPLLTLVSTCTDTLAVAVFLRNLSTKIVDGYLAQTEMSLLRRVLVIEADQAGVGDVWRRTLSQTGTTDQARDRLFTEFDVILDELASAYYEAGNE
ncbi:MAG: hypothetical protein ACE5NA_06945 [Nitrospiraceae bacterium]